MDDSLTLGIVTDLLLFKRIRELNKEEVIADYEYLETKELSCQYK